MIVSFRHKGLRDFYLHNDRRGLTQHQTKRIQRILTLLDSADGPDGMMISGFRLHLLRGDLHGFWSVRVSGNWRIIFQFEDGNACNVDLIDYH